MISDIEIVTGTVLDETTELTLADICRACSTSERRIVDLVDEGVLNPRGTTHDSWRFSMHCLGRAKIALRLQIDLGVNVAGVALALELLEEVNQLRALSRRTTTEPETR